MAKILFEIETGTFDSIVHVIEALRVMGHRVDYFLEPGILTRLSDASYLEKVNKEQYDIAVFTIHVNGAVQSSFVKKLKCKRYVFVPHDIFSAYLDGPIIPGLDKTKCYAVPFTLVQERYCQVHKMKGIPSRFPKLDMPSSTFSSGASLENTAVFIDSTLFKDHTFPYISLFDKVMLKRWNEYEYTLDIHADQTFTLNKPIRKPVLEKYGISNAPSELFGMHGMKAAVASSLFWFTRDSSMYVEALLEDRIPILYKAPRYDSFERGAKDNRYITYEKPVNSIVSEVQIALLGSTRFNAVTETNLANKIKAFRADRSLIRTTLDLLKKAWVFPGTLPRLEETIQRILDECK